MKNCRLLFAVTVILMLISLSSCKTKMKDGILLQKDPSPEVLFNNLKNSELKYNTITAKFSADAETQDDEKSFTGNIFIKRDSTIWLSISKFGLEVVRLLITQDSVKVINRIDNTYFIGDFMYINNLFNVDFDFDIIQSLVIGNDVSYYDNDKFKASLDDKCYKLSTVGRRKLKKYVKNSNEEQLVLIHDIWLDPETYKIVRISLKAVKDDENRKFEAFFSDFEMIENQLFPYTILYQINDEKRIKIKLSFSKVTLNKDDGLPFKIPESYKRVYY